MSPLRRFIRQLHLWLGLSVGFYFVLMGLTGSALVFYEGIDRWLHPEIRVEGTGPGPGWTSPVWDQALATVHARWPARDGAWRFESTGHAGPIPARYQARGEGHHGRRVMVWLTPDGREVLREADWGSYLMTWLYDLHMELLSHAPGRAVSGWLGLATAVLLLSGLWAWWPRGSWRTALHFKRDAVPIRRWRDIHKLAGLAALPLLLMLAGTGVMLALPDESNAVLARLVGPVNQMPMAHGSAGEGAEIPLAQALAVAHTAMPQSRLAWVESPGQGGGSIMVRVQQPDDPSFRFPHSIVWIDPHAGTIIGTQDRDRFGTASRVNNWLHPLHDASIGGLWLRVPVLLIGLVPLLLFVSGARRWWLMRQARQRGR